MLYGRSTFSSTQSFGSNAIQFDIDFPYAESPWPTVSTPCSELVVTTILLSNSEYIGKVVIPTSKNKSMIGHRAKSCDGRTDIAKNDDT